MSTNQYYILWRGQTTGPFTFDQIKQQLDQGRISLSHQVNDGGNLTFVEDFLDEKQAEVDRVKAEEEAQVAESKAQVEHARQKELLEVQTAAAVAQAQTQAAGSAPMAMPIPGQQQSSGGSDVVGVILGILIIAGIAIGGWFAYDHFSGPSLEQVELMTQGLIQESYNDDDKANTIISMDLRESGDDRYTGTAVVNNPRVGNVTCDVTAKVAGDKVVDWSITPR